MSNTENTLELARLCGFPDPVIAKDDEGYPAVFFVREFDTFPSAFDPYLDRGDVHRVLEIANAMGLLAKVLLAAGLEDRNHPTLELEDYGRMRAMEAVVIPCKKLATAALEVLKG